MIMDMFCSSLGDPVLQQHMLAIQTPTLADAVRAKNDYLRIRGGEHKPAGSFVRAFEGEPPGDVNLAETNAID